MENFYFTFGEENITKYVKITASIYERARKLMFDYYEDKWAFQYEEEEFLPLIKKYNYPLLFHLNEF